MTILILTSPTYKWRIRAETLLSVSIYYNGLRSPAMINLLFKKAKKIQVFYYSKCSVIKVCISKSTYNSIFVITHNKNVNQYVFSQ